MLDTLSIANNLNNIVDFEYKDKIYSIDVEKIVEGVDVNLDEYPYYVIVTDMNDTKLIVYYSTQRFSAKEYSSDNYLIGNNHTPIFKITIQKDGKVITQKGNTILQAGGKDITTKQYGYNDIFVTSNQDIYCQDKKIFSAFIYDNLGIGYKVDGNWDDIKIAQSNYETIKKAELMYNSMDRVELLFKYPSLLEQRGVILMAAEASETLYPNGGAALTYFLTKGESERKNTYQHEKDIYKADHKVRMIPLKAALVQSTSMKEKFESNIKTAIEITKKLDINENTTVTFINTVEDSGIATQEGGIDWNLTLNKYRIKIQCTIKKMGIKYEMKMKYAIEDYYDWDPNVDVDIDYKTLFDEVQGDIKKVLGPVLDILPKYLYTMHNAGLARNYTNYGEAMYKIEWYENGEDYYQVEEILGGI